jgi:hypothetical protein
MTMATFAVETREDWHLGQKVPLQSPTILGW